MNWIIDIIILIILGLCVLLGYKRGLAKCVIKILSFVIAIVVAFALFKPISNWIINNTEFDDSIRNAISQTVKEEVQESGKVKEESNLPQSMVEYINEEIKTNVSQTKETVVNNIAQEVSVLAVNVCAWIGIFILTRIALLIVTAIFSLITDLPVLKQIDKAGGIIYGILEALVIVFVIFGIISFISPMIENTQLIAAINKSIIGSALYNNNVLLKIVF